MRGLLFDLKEFALHDGEGIRLTVFLKGCPLRCLWCHNPEGLKPEREIFLRQNGCLHCGLCRKPCSHPDCQGLGRCLHICPNNLVRVAGTEWESDALAEKLLRKKDALNGLGGGVTLSGGEPLLQPDFCVDLLDRLRGNLHCAIETSGYASPADFRRVTERCDFIMMDLKLADPIQHRELTGVDNAKILANAAWLKASGLPHLFRTPLIPGLTDTAENLRGIASIAGDSRVELLPYNTMAAAKYAGVGRKFTDRIDPANAHPVDLSVFRNAVLQR